jgi:hypothetical protein
MRDAGVDGRCVQLSQNGATRGTTTKIELNKPAVAALEHNYPIMQIAGERWS